MKLFLAILLLAPFQGRNDYKSYYKEAEDLFAKGQYQAALEKYRDAFNLETKPQRYREEGTQVRSYLPRYRIALCYEQIDLAQAEEWVNKSKEALEENVIKRVRKELASYNSDMERISAAIGTFKAEIKTRYDNKLREARDLLARNRFEEAREAFTELQQIDPSRTEATAGLDSIAPNRNIFIRSKALEVRTALSGEDFNTAEAILKQIREIDPTNSEVALLRGEIDNKQADVKRRADEAARIARAEAEAKPDPVVTREPVRENPPTTPKVDTAAQARRQAARQKAALKAALLETLTPYRRGDPQNALKKLREIDLPGSENSASFHWLNGLYLVSTYQHMAEPDIAYMEQARTAMIKATDLLPGFQPDPDLYPAFVIRFFADLKN